MDLLNQTQDLCRQYGIIPARSKGQNFLITSYFYDKIVDSAGLNSEDTVLEVGPGLGFLTNKLAKKVKKVIAVELDDKLAGALKQRLEKEKIDNVEVVNENVLDFCIKYKVSSIKGGEKEEKLHNTLYLIPNTNYKIVANLPYNITSVFLRKFLTAENKPESMILMLQKEVAERIVAEAGQLSILAVSVQFYAGAEIIANVSKDNFWPEPEVDSAIIKLKVFQNSPLNKGGQRGIKELKSPQPPLSRGSGYSSVDKEKDFFRMVKFGFSSKRKMLKNNLANGYHISTREADNLLKLASFNQKIRAQELSVTDWLKLFGIIQENML